MSARDRPTTNLDEMAYDPTAWPFEVGIGPSRGVEADQAIADADLVLGSIGFPYDDLPRAADGSVHLAFS